jgi:hypothetical protein
LQEQPTGGIALNRETGEQKKVVPGPYARTARELKEIIETERLGEPFLVWRDAVGEQIILGLAQLERVTVGRRETNSVVIAADAEVSRIHAELERVGGEWAIGDDGLSRNGTYVNGTRISQRRRLRDGDTVRIGRTVIEYRAPTEGSTVATSAGTFLPIVDSLTETQRRILIALCRPYKNGGRHAIPASNSQIAAEVFLSVDAVKNHLRLLFQRFDIAALPQNQKRARLVECAFQWGLVSEREL